MKTVRKAKNPNFQLITNSFLPDKERLHVYNNGVICVTESKGHVHPDNKDPKELVLDATYGVIPLWEQNVTLNWRFSKSFGSYFRKPEEAKAGIRELLASAINAWQDACPVKFHEDDDVYDFEIDMHQEDCDTTGCVLASAFFPGPGRNTFYIYPAMFGLDEKEQLETLEHEIGHVFGLRHFFAKREIGYSSVEYGEQNEVSIMNYGDNSTLTPTDILDLKTLYTLVWSGQIKQINGTEIKLFAPYHSFSQNKQPRFEPAPVANSAEVHELLSKQRLALSGKNLVMMDNLNGRNN